MTDLMTMIYVKVVRLLSGVIIRILLYYTGFTCPVQPSISFSTPRGVQSDVVFYLLSMLYYYHLMGLCSSSSKQGRAKTLLIIGNWFYRRGAIRRYALLTLFSTPSCPTPVVQAFDHRSSLTNQV
jgi:hypothetical protein